AQNLVTGGINKIFGTNIAPAIPASQIAENVSDTVGLPFYDPETMSNSEKLAYDMNRFGTQAVGIGSMLARRAPQVAAQVVPSQTRTGRVADAFARPYAENASRAHIGDAVGGVGAGIGVNAADNLVPEDAMVFGVPVGGGLKQATNIFAPILGAV